MKTLPFFLIALFFIQCDNPSDRMTSFRPGELWPDNNGVHINAHGGGILFHDGLYYLVWGT
jgi:hypothetical protein